MNTKNVLCASLALCLAFQAKALTDGSWNFSVSNGEATLTGYSGTGPEELVLPSSVESDDVAYPVTAIGSSAFSGKSWIKTLCIPDSVTNIGSSAFYSCNAMTNATIGAGVEVIGSSAFSFCSALEGVEIPSSVTNIGSWAFDNCKSIREVTWHGNDGAINGDVFSGQTNWVSLVIIGNGNTTVKGFSGKAVQNVTISGVSALFGSAFESCSQLKTFEIADDSLGSIGSSAFSRAGSLLSISIPGSVTNIGDSAFWSCGAMTNATIGAGVEVIGPSAFNYCSALEGVEIPSSVTNIGNSAFDNCKSIREVVWHGNDGTINGDVFSSQTNWVSLVIIGNGNTTVKGFSGKAMQNVSISGVSALLRGAFENCSQLKTFEISDNSLGNIGASAFSRASSLVSISIPGSVTNIGDSAFYSCSAMTNAAIGAGVEVIGSSAFSFCSALEGVEIPSSVTNIGSWAFDNCKSIREVTWHGNDGAINGDVFSGQTNWVSLVIIGNGNTTVKGFSGKAVQNVTISGVSALFGSAFESCSQLKTFEIADDSLGSIGSSAFSRAGSLLSISIPGSVTNIGDSAFWSCGAMTNATIGAGVEVIGPSAFNYCSALEGVEIPSSVTNIGNSAFDNCKSIREVVWHGNDGTINGDVFSSQTNWVSLVIIGNGNTTVKGFSGKAVQNVTISGVSSLLGSAFEGCSRLQTFEIADGSLGNIGASAFSRVGSLSSISIPASVTNIGSSAFWSCSSLKSVVFRQTAAPAVGDNAFSYVPSDATFYNYEGSTGYDVTAYPWNSFSLKTLMADGTVGISGAINASETWNAGVPYQILAPTRVRGSSTVLTISAGAEVRFAEGASLSVENSATVKALGERDNPVLFTSAAETKAAGDWGYVGGSNGRVDLRYCTVEYGGGNPDTGAVHGNGAYITLDGTTVQNAGNGALGGYNIHATNCVLRASGAGIGAGPWRLDVVNSVIDACGVAVEGSNRYVYNTIIADCESFGTDGTFDHCLFDGECSYTTAGYNRHNLAGDPKFLADTFYRIAADSPAVDAGDGRYAPETDYFGAPRMASTNVVAVGEPDARGICPDIGICEVEGLLEVNLPDLAAEDVTSPATLVPGTEATFSYVVTNRGDGAAAAPWTEQLWLTNATGCVRIQSWRATDGLSTNDAVQRVFTITIPDTIELSGSVRALVRLDTDGDMIQKNAYSHEASSDEATLAGVLTISLAESVREGGSIWGQVKRSGGNGAALAVSLAVSGDAAAQVTNMPQTVTINAGSATAGFYARVADNAAVDGDRAVALSASADGFAAVQKALTIVDDEVPRLTIEVVGVTTNSFREGTNLTVRISRPASVSGQALTVHLGGVGSLQFSYPATITIAAGEEYAEFEFASVDDSSSELAAALSLRASASGYASAQYDFTLEDDDIPGVSLALSPETVSEGAGLNAVYAFLERTDDDAEKLRKSITVFLAASEDRALILPESVTIPANTRSVQFAIGVVDNAEMEAGGSRTVTIDASIRIDSCGCSWRPQEAGGALSATLEIVDDDGPALFVDVEPATMREGLAEAGVLTVRANSASVAQDVVVTLTHDGASEIALPATVTIPAGANSATATVRTLDDGEEDGSKVVSVYAEAAGFAPGSTRVLVTDQNLPDFVVRDIRPAEASIIAGELVELGFDLANAGFRNRSGAVPYAVYWVEGTNTWRYAEKDRVLSGVTEAGVATNAPLHVVCDVPAPSAAGNGRIAVVADPEGSIVELDAANNAAWSDAVTVSPSYVTTDVACDKDVYGTGEKITVTGVAVKPDGATPAANVPVEVYLLSGGMRRTVSATTDDAGEFAASYVPMSGEAGRFDVGASYPGIGAAAAQDTCDVAGFVLTGLPSSRYVEDLTLGDVVTNASARIRNPCAIDLTGVTAEAVGLPESCAIEVLGLPAGGVLAAGEFIDFRCVFSAVNASPGRDYEKFSIRLSSAEGAELTIPVFFYSQAKQAHLESTPASISATMTKGRTRTVSFDLANLGYGEAVDVRVVPPDVDWLRVAGGAQTASLTNNQSVTVTLELSPDADIELNRNFSGRLAVNGRNKGEDAERTFLTVPMTFMAVSEETGGVRIDCVDDATYNLASAPHLEGAHVKISNPYTGAVVAEGESGADGLFEADGLPEGTYQLVVTAAKHGNYAGAVTVDPGRTARVTAFLQYQAITANWTVTRTEIEDKYQVDLVLEFETSVPVPVVKMDFMEKMPDIQPGESFATKAVFSNLGLIRADNVSFELPSFYGYVWVYPSGSFSLAAGAARAVPVILYRLPYSIEGDYANYLADPGHSGVTSAGMPHAAIADALGDDEEPSMSDFVSAVYGGAGMGVVQTSRAGSGTSSSHAGPLNGDEPDGNPCTGYALYVYNYECKGTRWVQGPHQLVYRDNCPQGYAPAVDLGRTGDPDPAGPSNGVEQQVKIPPGMNGGDFWVFEDGCNGGVRNKLLPCLKALAKAGIDINNMFVGGALPGAGTVIGFVQKGDEAWNSLVDPYSSLSDQIEKVGELSESSKNLATMFDKPISDAVKSLAKDDGASDGGNTETYEKTLSGVRAAASLYKLKGELEECDNEYGHDTPESNREKGKKIIGTVNDCSQALPGVGNSKFGKFLGHLNTIKEIDDAFSDVKSKCLAEMGKTGDPLSGLKMAAPRSAQETFAQKILGEPIGTGDDERENIFLAAIGVLKRQTEVIKEVLGDRDGWLDADYGEVVAFLSDISENNCSLDGITSWPSGLGDDDKSAFAARWNNLIGGIYEDGQQYVETFGGANVIRLDVLSACSEWASNADVYMYERHGAKSIIQGFAALFANMLDEVLESFGEASAGVCAKVSLKLSQTYTMTREAFEGTLTLYNGHDANAMTNVWLELRITDTEGDDRTELFEIGAKSGGSLEANGSNVVNVNDVAPKGEGTAVVRFVPAIAAAPETPVAYRFGGKVHYRDPFTGEEAAITLLPVTLEVNPMPQLHLDYFVQRDVYADDPFTKEVVEASMPAELAVLVRNEGYGDAKGVRISSVQPEIVENEKGLMVDFRLSDYSLDAAALNGATAGLGLDDVNLGTIAARTSAVAQWWLTSTLQGHFSGMRASVAHLNSQGIVDTSLIRDVAVHPLIRSVDVGDALPAFLAADGSKYGNPDRLYRADGEVLDVRSDTTAATADAVRGAECEIAVTANLPGSGPFYAKVELPGAEEYEVVAVRRDGGGDVPVRNAWITDRTFVDGADPRVETFLHLFDVAATAGAKSYVVTLRAKPTDAPAVAGIEGVAADALVTNPVESVVVAFTKKIDPYTFTADDVTVRWQGVLTNGVVSSIAPVDGDLSRYEVRLAGGFARQEGRFIVQAFSSGVASLSGTLGRPEGRQIGWTYYAVDKPAVTTVRGWIDGTTVNSVANVTVQFAGAIDPASFTYAAIKIDGIAVGDEVTVTVLNKANTSFRVTGLDATIAKRRGPNDHTLEIDAALVRNAAGVAGVAKFTSTVTIDSDAPTATLADNGEVFGSRKWTLAFSKPVAASTVSVSALSLTRDGASVAVPSSARLTQASDTVWTLSGLDAALTADGAYALSFDASRVRDASGNAGIGAATSEWTYSSAPPAPVADLAFAPDWGTNATDGVTWQRNVTVSGSVPDGAYSIEILARDAAGGESVLVGTFHPEAETAFEKAAVLPVGRGTIVVRCANSSGKSSDTEKEFFVDAIPLSFAFVGFPEDGEGQLTNDVALVFSEPVTNVTADCFSLRRGVRTAVDIPAGALTISPDASNLVWTVSGLDALTASGGIYRVTFDVSRVEKLSSGLHGEMDEDAASVTWHYTPPDTTPPELLAILFDGMSMFGADGCASVASNGAAQVKFVFSEPVNFSSLKTGGWLDRAIRMQLLDAGGAVTGEVALAASQFRWRSGENAIVWTRGERILPVGRLRLLLDAGLIADSAGNPLVGNSEIDSFVRFSKRAALFAADGEFAAPANFGGELVVGVKKNGKGEAHYYGFNGTKGACVVENVAASNCLGVSVAKIGNDLYHGTYDGRIYKNGALLEGANAGRERAVLSVCDGALVIGGTDGKLVGLDGVALKNLSGEDLVVDTAAPVRSAAAFSEDWTHEGRPVLIAGRGRGGLALYAGDGEGGWDGARPLTLAGAANTNRYERTRPVAIDVDGDGLDDLVTGYADGTVDVRYASIEKAFAYEFEALPFRTLEEALDTDELAPELIWTTTTNAPWFAQLDESSSDGDHAVSAAAQQGSTLGTVVVGPGTLAFRWKKGGTGGTYVVKTNGVDALPCAAADWSAASVAVGSGLVQVTFVAAGGAVGYLDCVNWTADSDASEDEKKLQAEKAAYDPDFAAFMQTYGGVDPETATAGDYLRAMATATGKTGPEGPLTLLDEFLAGTDPTDETDRLYATIAIEDGIVYVGWVPDLNAEGKVRRVYKVYGKRTLSDDWSVDPLTDAEIDGGEYRFFRVIVTMP